MRLIDADRLQEEYQRSHGGKRLALIDMQPTASGGPPARYRLPETDERISKKDAVGIAGAVWDETKDVGCALIWQMLKELPPVDRWIDPAEQLPYFGEPVLLKMSDTRGTGYRTGAYDYDPDTKRECWYIEGSGDCLYGEDKKKVLAWMPIEPWKGGQQWTI